MHTTNTLTFTACLLLLCTGASLIQTKKNISNNIIHTILLIITLFYYHTPISTLLLSLLFLGLIFQKKQQENILSTQILIFLIIWLKIQFIGGSLLNGINFLLLILIFLATESTTSLKKPFSSSSITKWKLITICVVTIVFIAPIGYSTLLQTINPSNKKENTLIKFANLKINSFSNVAIEGTARTSMWKSAIPWTRDHIILGSGLDTIKYYYPKYRRPEYGKLEGGHNYTPDRLHNEYLNTLSTKGILGFISLYILFVGGTFIYLLNHIYHHTGSKQYLITGLISGSLVYLGQVLFNFGVVATLIYFFLFMGLSIGLSLNHDND
jgi:O-antigen ligase